MGEASLIGAVTVRKRLSLPRQFRSRYSRHRLRRAGINSFQWRSIADCRSTFTSHFRLGFEPIVEIATIPFATKTSLRKSTSNSRQTKLRLCGVSKSMLTSACEFVEDELLSQTANDMQT